MANFKRTVFSSSKKPTPSFSSAGPSFKLPLPPVSSVSTASSSVVANDEAEERPSKRPRIEDSPSSSRPNPRPVNRGATGKSKAPLVEPPQVQPEYCLLHGRRLIPPPSKVVDEPPSKKRQTRSSTAGKVPYVCFPIFCSVTDLNFCVHRFWSPTLLTPPLVALVEPRRPPKPRPSSSFRLLRSPILPNLGELLLVAPNRRCPMITTMKPLPLPRTRSLWILPIPRPRLLLLRLFALVPLALPSFERLSHRRPLVVSIFSSYSSQLLSSILPRLALDEGGSSSCHRGSARGLRPGFPCPTHVFGLAPGVHYLHHPGVSVVMHGCPHWLPLF